MIVLRRSYTTYSYSFFVQAQNNDGFNTGFSETISLKILGEDREILILIPNSNGGSKIKVPGYLFVYGNGEPDTISVMKDTRGNTDL